MHRPSRSVARLRPALPFVLLVSLLCVLLIAGGASRADALGQVVVRAASAVILAVAALLGPRPALSEARPVVVVLLAAALLAVIQLIPLPPEVWRALPGRAMLAEAAAAGGEAQPWRPWSIVPDATANAAASLIVPFAALLLAAGLTEAERRRLPGLLLIAIAASTLVGLLQFSGVNLNNPLINDTTGQVGGTFANRNHFALFLAFGCVLAPVWAFLDGRRPGWRGPAALGLVLLFALTILASGSRAGLGLGVLALGFGLVLSRREIRRALGGRPRWAFPALIAGIVGVVAVFVLLSVAAGRAVSIERAFAIDAGTDMRSRGLPTVLAMIGTYFPVGSGLGGFDPVFRAHEPFGLLKLTYFNHAHNDFLEVVLDAGLPGLLLLLSAVAWWGWASVRAWRAGSGARHAAPKLGSAMLLLVLVASAFDYPARTPMVMAVIVLAALWLAGAGRIGAGFAGAGMGGAARRPEERRVSALPDYDQHL